MFEPNPEVSKLNLSRCELNGFSNYYLEQICLSNQQDEMDFYVSKSSYCSSLAKDQAESDGIEKIIKVPVSTLDLFWSQTLELKRIRNCIAKIDVEGFEWEVFQGGANFFAEVNASIIVEINRNNEKKKNCFRMFKNLNYQLFGMTNAKSRFLIELNSEDDFLNSDAKNYFFTSDEKLAKSVRANYLLN